MTSLKTDLELKGELNRLEQTRMELISRNIHIQRRLRDINDKIGLLRAKVYRHKG